MSLVVESPVVNKIYTPLDFLSSGFISTATYLRAVPILFNSGELSEYDDPGGRGSVAFSGKADEINA
jgi:hypothetical protein